MNSQDVEKSATAQVRNVPISRKKGVELARAIRNKALDEAYKILNDVIALKKAVPYKRYNRDKAHKTGIGPGGFPVKCATYFLKVLKNAEANAVNKGLSRNDLYVSFISVDKGQTRLKAGRHRGRQAKNAHIKITLTEKAVKTSKKKEDKPKSKPAKKAESKKTESSNKSTNSTKSPKSPKSTSKKDAQKVEPKKDKSGESS